MCYGRPCELSELSFDSGPLDAIPAYKMPPHASSRLWETMSRCYWFLEIDFSLREVNRHSFNLDVKLTTYKARIPNKITINEYFKTYLIINIFKELYNLRILNTY